MPDNCIYNLGERTGRRGALRGLPVAHMYMDGKLLDHVSIPSYFMVERHLPMRKVTEALERDIKNKLLDSSFKNALDTFLVLYVNFDNLACVACRKVLTLKDWCKCHRENRQPLEAFKTTDRFSVLVVWQSKQYLNVRKYPQIDSSYTRLIQNNPASFTMKQCLAKFVE